MNCLVEFDGVYNKRTTKTLEFNKFYNTKSI